MRQLRSALSRIAGVFTKNAADDDTRAELEAHVEMETAEFIRRGMEPSEARRQALLAAGGLTQATEAVRDQRGLPWLESIVSDFRYAFRALRHAPGFSAIVIVVPLIAPVGKAFGVDPVHMGVIFLANLELGFLTPPIGMNLFLASSRFGVPLLKVYRQTFPFLVILLLGVLVITYVPQMTTGVVDLLGR